MYLLKLAYRNFFRNTRRSIISGVSIAIAITTILFAHSYIKGATEDISDNIVKLISGHIRITTREYERRERMIPLSEALDLSPEFYSTLANKEIVVSAPRIKFGVLLGAEELTTPALGYAVDARKEARISGLDRRIVKGSYLDSVTPATILGQGLAQRLNMKVGDTLTIFTRTAYDSPTGINLVVKGIFATGIGGMDRSLFYIPLAVGQRLLNLEGRATEFVLILKNPARAVTVARAIAAQTDYSVVPFQYNPLLRYLNSFGIILWFIYAIILLVACSTIANTMMMVIFERTREIGMMKAMGLSNPSVVGLLAIEAGIIGLVGSFLGTVLGAVGSYWFKYRGIDLTLISSSTNADIPFGPVIHFSPTPLIILAGFLFGLAATVVVALVPIGRAIRLEPAKALKTV